MTHTRTERAGRTARRLQLLREINRARRYAALPSYAALLVKYEAKLAALDEMYGYKRTSKGNAPPLKTGDKGHGSRGKNLAKLYRLIEERKVRG